MGDSVLNRTIETAGPDCVLMISPAAYDDLRSNSDQADWEVGQFRKWYRGALIEVHDEWSWGWNVRDESGSIVHLKATPND